MEFSSQPWFPSGILAELEEISDANSGFSNFKIHTIHGTLNLIWPKYSPDDLKLWVNLEEILNNNEIKPWGIVSSLELEKMKELKVIENHKNITVVLEGDKKVIAKYNPLVNPSRESKFHKMNIEEIGVKPIGGLKFNKHDLIIFYEFVESTDTLAKRIRKSLANSEYENLESQLKIAGNLLGKFHKIMDENLAPPIPELWNNRLKRLEHITASNTLWRAPHSKHTEAIWTHGDFNFDRIIFDSENGNYKLYDFSGEPLQSIIDSTGRFPAIRDIAYAYRSIAKILHELKIDDKELETNMKKWLFESWSAEVPDKWANLEALNAYKGGILIWEYDCALNNLFYNQAFEKKNKDDTLKWLSNVTRIQSVLFKNRSYSALSKTSAIIGFAMLFGWNYVNNYLLIGAMTFSFITSWIFFKIYHSKAPEPW